MYRYDMFNNDEAVEKLLSDYKGLSLSFLKKSDECEYRRFKKVEDLQEELFNNIKRNPLSVAYIPIIGVDKIKWFSNEVVGSPILIVQIREFKNKNVLSFIGVRGED